MVIYHVAQISSKENFCGHHDQEFFLPSIKNLSP